MLVIEELLSACRRGGDRGTHPGVLRECSVSKNASAVCEKGALAPRQDLIFLESSEKLRFSEYDVVAAGPRGVAGEPAEKATVVNDSHQDDRVEVLEVEVFFPMGRGRGRNRYVARVYDTHYFLGGGVAREGA